ncbi:hypothetical protein ACHAXM_004693 [Skeletonema potamos]
MDNLIVSVLLFGQKYEWYPSITFHRRPTTAKLDLVFPTNFSPPPGSVTIVAYVRLLLGFRLFLSCPRVS